MDKRKISTLANDALREIGYWSGPSLPAPDAQLQKIKQCLLNIVEEYRKP